MQPKKDKEKQAKAAAKAALEAEWSELQTQEEVQIDRPPFLGDCDGGPRG